VALVTLSLSGDAEAQRQLAIRVLDVVHREVASASVTEPREEVGKRVQEVFVALLERDAEELRAWDPDEGTTLEQCVARLSRRRVGVMLAGRSTVKPESEDERRAESPLEGEERDAVLAKIVARLDQGETLTEDLKNLRVGDLEAPVELATSPDLPVPPPPAPEDRGAVWRPTILHVVGTIVLAIAVASAIAIWAG
jgi:hypothetical protein